MQDCPSIFSSDHSINDAQALAENLGIQFEIISIKKINEQMLDGLSPIFNGSEVGLAEENLQARIRGNILMAAAKLIKELKQKIRLAEFKRRQNLQCRTDRQKPIHPELLPDCNI